MQMEIKFRAFDDGQMLTMPLDTNFGISRFFGMLREDAIIMKFTGEQDFNGKEIFVSDILSGKYKVEVYQNEEGTFMVKFHNNPKINKPISLRKFLLGREKAGTKERDSVIIGNTFENANLLQGVS